MWRFRLRHSIAILPWSYVRNKTSGDAVCFHPLRLPFEMTFGSLQALRCTMQPEYHCSS